MRNLLKKGKYNAGKRPSEHNIGKHSFKKDNKGAIPPNVFTLESLLTMSNTSSSNKYLTYCKEKEIKPHPARMQLGLAEFFIKFLTTPRNLVFDPFAGSNTTGAIAEQLKRRWVSVEPVSSYVESSLGRFG
jgi:site-specific DNA-methyltransferase (cytosine-N4-specific)